MLHDPTVEHLVARAHRRPLLSAAEEVALARRAAGGDPHAREELILANVRLVVSVARRYRGAGVPFADLVQEGMIGLIRAVDGYDWRRGFRFSTYGTIWIRKYLQNCVDASGGALRLPASLVRDARRVAVAERELTVRLGRRPTDAELAEATGLGAERLDRVRLADQPPLALDRPVGDDGATTLGDLLPGDEPTPDVQVAARWRTGALRQAVASLPETEQAVIRLRFGAGRDGRHPTFDEIGGAIGRSAERARQIEERALRRLAAHHELAPLRPAA
jgi:RNA polymerase primary sigma factor